MKTGIVNKVKSYQNELRGLALVSLMGLGLTYSHKKSECIQTNNQHYVLKNNPQIYQELQKANASYEEWQRVATQLKLDSITQTNYAKGVQAVRDSLAKANMK